MPTPHQIDLIVNAMNDDVEFLDFARKYTCWSEADVEEGTTLRNRFDLIWNGVGPASSYRAEEMVEYILDAFEEDDENDTTNDDEYVSLVRAYVKGQAEFYDNLKD